MESSRYLCAIKVLYTGRATFEIKGGDRTSGGGQNGQFFAAILFSTPLLSLPDRSPPLSFFHLWAKWPIYLQWPVTRNYEEQSLGKTSRWGRTNERLHRDKARRLILYVGCYKRYVFLYTYKYLYIYIFILLYFFQNSCHCDIRKT